MTSMKLSGLLAGVILLGAVAQAGSDGAGSSGGGDNIADDTGAAWFLGTERTIRACFELAPGFGINEGTAKAEIEAAFGEWESYIDRKFKFADIKLGISTRVMVNSKCQGSEDLTFHFGTINEEIRLAKAKYSNPTAFAFKRSYDREKQWGQGWIWFAPPASVFPSEKFPDWSPKEPVVMPAGEKQPWVLRAMLMHEVGHILGNSHVSGTIMSERISEYIRAGYTVDATRIDQARELAVCWQCDYRWDGNLSIYGQTLPGSDPTAPYREVEARNFEILTGHPPKQSNWLSASIKADGYNRGTVLEVSDQFEKMKFPIEFSTDPLSAINRTTIEDSTPIFKRMVPTAPGQPSWFFSEKVQGVVAYGTITTFQGERLTLIMERNLPVPESAITILPPVSVYGPDFRADFRLKMIHQGQIRPLFEASWLQLISGPVISNPFEPIPAPTPSPTPTL